MKVMLIVAYLIAGASTAQAMSEIPVELVGRDGVRMRGVVTAPHRPRALALILPGSGNVSLDGDVSGPFLGYGAGGKPAKLSEQLAQTLVELGVAALRYSKRGVDDALEHPRQTLPYLINDAESALNWLRDWAPGLPTAIVGFSEGGLIATAVAARTSVDALFLLAPSTRGIDETLSFQFFDWPVKVIERRLDIDLDGRLSVSEMERAGPGFKLPLSDFGWASLPSGADGSVGIVESVVPFYRRLLAGVFELGKTPQFSFWYQSLQAMPAFRELTENIQAPTYVYVGKEDTQMDWAWIAADSRLFSSLRELRVFAGLGHCFSKPEGRWGEIKTSGPFEPGFLRVLAGDADAWLTTRP